MKNVKNIIAIIALVSVLGVGSSFVNDAAAENDGSTRQCVETTD